MKKKAISKLAEVYKHLSSFAVHDKRNTRQPKENKHEGKCISPFLFHSLAPCIYYIYCPLLQNKGSLNNGHDMDKSNGLQETQRGNNTNGMCRWSVAEEKKKKSGTLTGPIPVPPVLFHPLRKHKSSPCIYVKAQEKG